MLHQLTLSQFGAYDDPPASSESSTPRTRRTRLREALRATEDMAANDLAEMGATIHSSRRAVLGPLQRRRQRSPGSDPRDTGSSEEARRRRPKRRKLDTELSLSARPPIKYGHFGQVEPGRLKLEIISCDGGEKRDPRHPSTYLGALNILKHDKSVYCSERPSSGIVLRHADDRPLCLEKLFISGPEHGFTASVREGLVYVAMNLNDLSRYMDPPPHARVRGVHTPPYRRQRNFRTSPERLTLSDALRDPEVNAALEQRERDYALRADTAHDLAEESFYNDSYSFSRDDASNQQCDIPPAPESPDLVDAADDDTLPVALLSDEEPGPEENSPQDVLDFRLQRFRNMRRRFEMDSWDREERWAGVNNAYPADTDARDRDSSWGLRHIDAMMARSRMADSPQREDATEERDRDDGYSYPGQPGSSSYYNSASAKLGGTELSHDGLDDPNVTCARFQIQRGKYKVAIKFDPPVSGRFILLKLWANRSNVDVQSVIAKGFAGPRFFPSIELR